MSETSPAPDPTGAASTAPPTVATTPTTSQNPWAGLLNFTGDPLGTMGGNIDSSGVSQVGAAPVTVGGKQYYRVGDLPNDPTYFHNLDASQFIYDPTYGVLTTQDNLTGGSKAGGFDQFVQAGIAAGTLGVVGPAILGGGLGGTTAATGATDIAIPAAEPLIADGSAALPAMVDAPSFVAPGATAADVATAAAPALAGPAADTAVTGATETAGASLPGVTDAAVPFDTATVPQEILNPTMQPPPDVSVPPPDVNIADQSWMDKILSKVNPASAAALGVNLFAAARANRKGADAPGDIAAIAKPFQTQGQAMIDQYNKGIINPADEFNINKWVSDNVARTRDFYARAGMADSTAAQNAIAQIEAQGQSMRDTSLKGLLSQGMQILGMATGPLEAAAEAELNNDASLTKSISSAINSYIQMQAVSAGRAPAAAAATTTVT